MGYFEAETRQFQRGMGAFSSEVLSMSLPVARRHRDEETNCDGDAGVAVLVVDDMSVSPANVRCDAATPWPLPRKSAPYNAIAMSADEK